MSSQYDVVIAGGGLAGLTLARQLHLEAPQLRVLVCEKRQHPVPEAAFKVGESSVEIGAHYFQKVIGLEPLLCRDHLPKLGLRYFFPCDQNRDLSRRVELGAAAFPRVPSFQLDRGRLENSLLLMARETGAEVLDGCAVRRIELGRSGHTVTVATPGGSRTVQTRWLVDSSGRAGLLKRQLGMSRPLDPSRERLLVPGRGSRARRRLVGRPGLAGSGAVGTALAQHQPSDGHRLLGVADSARLRQHQLRHRRRRGAASVPSPESLRSRARLAAGVRAAVRRRRGALRRPARRLSRPAALRARLHAGLLAGPLGADGRIGRLHRSVLFSRARTSSPSATTSSPT